MLQLEMGDWSLLESLTIHYVQLVRSLPSHYVLLSAYCFVLPSGFGAL
jgi:hypothetical protein